MRRESLQLLALAAAIASFAFQGVGLAQDDTADRNARFYNAKNKIENSQTFQVLKQKVEVLSAAAKAQSGAGTATALEDASQTAFTAFQEKAQGGAAAAADPVTVRGVATAIGAAVPPEQIRAAAPNIPESQRQAVGTLLKYVPDLKKSNSGIDNIFVPDPNQQAKDAARLQQVQQSAAPASAQIQQSVQQQGSPGMCLDR
jgi:hypothetical protein